MATGLRYPLSFKQGRGLETEYDPFEKKAQNIRLALLAPPNYYPLTSFSGNALYNLLQNTPLSLLIPTLVVYYCKQAVEPFVSGVAIREYGDGSDVVVDTVRKTITILLLVDFLDLEASRYVQFSPDVGNPSASLFRLSDSI